ncbi:hypothetical protein FLX56_15175 [Synechococcus moorigangaii CMS01]|nr:hypothetical protein [Synechococcus moorigangaii CMS01]
MKPSPYRWVLLGLIPLMTFGALIPATPALADHRDNNRNRSDNFYEYSRERWDDDDDDWDDRYDDDDDDDDDRDRYRRGDWRNTGYDWESIFDDIDRNYNRRIPRDLFSRLRRDQNLRRSLLQIFGNQRGNENFIRDIILSILFDRNSNFRDFRNQQGFNYRIDADCLPSRWRQEYYRGNQIPPNLLRQCGRVRTFDD